MGDKSVYTPTHLCAQYVISVFDCTGFSQSGAGCPIDPEQSHTQCRLWELGPNHSGLCRTNAAETSFYKSVHTSLKSNKININKQKYWMFS